MKDRKQKYAPSENDIIDIKKKNQSVTNTAVNKHRRVNHATDETMRQEEIAETMNPSTRGLFQPVNSLFETKNIVRLIQMNKTRQWFHINFLS